MIGLAKCLLHVAVILPGRNVLGKAAEFGRKNTQCYEVPGKPSSHELPTWPAERMCARVNIV